MCIVCTYTCIQVLFPVLSNSVNDMYGLGYKWTPEELTIYVGDTVMWSWTGVPFAQWFSVAQVSGPHQSQLYIVHRHNIMCMCIHTYVHTCMYTHACMHRHTHTYTCVCTAKCIWYTMYRHYTYILYLLYVIVVMSWLRLCLDLAKLMQWLGCFLYSYCTCHGKMSESFLRCPFIANLVQ